MRRLHAALIAAVIMVLPVGALACGNSFGGLDTHNALWEQTLGVRFDNPVIKASSMNDRCWVEDRIDGQVLARIAKEGLAPDETVVVYAVPGIRITPDCATYSDDREAYEHGQRAPLGQDVFRVTLASAHAENIEALSAQLAERGMSSEAGKAGKVENSQGLASFGGVEVTLFTSHLKQGFLKGDTYTSAAMFVAPRDPGLLVIFLGDTNTETDRVGGIRLEETLHQALRDMEIAD